MIIRLANHTYTGRSAAEVVHQMHLDSRSPAVTDEQFMAEAAGRVLLQEGIPIRSGRPEDFITDLLSAGLVTRERLQ
jgi:hypothetical protein